MGGFGYVSAQVSGGYHAVGEATSPSYTHIDHDQARLVTGSFVGDMTMKQRKARPDAFWNESKRKMFFFVHLLSLRPAPVACTLDDAFFPQVELSLSTARTAEGRWIKNPV